MPPFFSGLISTPAANSKEFRPDIEGLRAVAILPILFCHLSVPAFTGGFIGVDIFYVISGYLITLSLFGHDSHGALNWPQLADFYRNRIVRILPALAVLLIACLPLAAALLLPQEIRSTGNSIAAAAGFSANIYFWKTTPYFDHWAELQPMLHLWSLGVEEQFYGLFPIGLIAAQRIIGRWFVRPALVAVLLIVLLSFALSCFMSARAPIAGFYLLPPRGWELGIGALLALLPGAIRTKLQTNWLPIIGLVMIILALATLSPDSSFPGFNALLPVMGTMLIIAGGNTGPVAAMLRVAPMRWTGRISFSLYLWHWPLIVFYRMQTGVSLSPTEQAMLAVGSFALGSISFVMVEQTFLRRYKNTRPRAVISIGLMACAALLVSGLILASRADQWRHYPPDVRKVLAYQSYLNSPQWLEQTRSGHCHGDDADFNACLKSVPGKPSVVLIGDSHGGMLAKTLADKVMPLPLLQATSGGCRPLVIDAPSPGCGPMFSSIDQRLSVPQNIGHVVLAIRWEQRDFPALRAILAKLKARQLPVTVIGPFPRYSQSVPRLLANALLADDREILLRAFLNDTAIIDQEIEKLVLAGGGHYFSPYRRLCGASGCSTRLDDGSPVQFDASHVTRAGADYVLRDFRIGNLEN